MREINYKRIILYVVFVLLFILFIVIYNLKYKVEEKEVSKAPEVKVKILNDYNRFFTIDSCIFKYINYNQNKDIDNLLKILNKDYINTNSISSDNIFNYIENLEGMNSFKTKKVYYMNLKEDLIEYYVYGVIKKEEMDSIGEKKDRYFTLTFNISNQTFDIRPSDKMEFEEVIK